MCRNAFADTLQKVRSEDLCDELARKGFPRAADKFGSVSSTITRSESGSQSSPANGMEERQATPKATKHSNGPMME